MLSWAHRAPQYCVASSWKIILGKHLCIVPFRMPLLDVCTQALLLLFLPLRGGLMPQRNPETVLKILGMRDLGCYLMLLIGSCVVTHRTETLPLLVLH